MALVTCPNCGKQASNKAQKCFICGYETLNLVAPPKKESQTTQVTTRITPPTITPPTIDESQIRCPKCSSTQIIANKKGFDVGRAVVGGFLTLGIGAVAGLWGSNDLRLNCLNCGHRWKPKK
jgi:hypothetical protein